MSFRKPKSVCATSEGQYTAVCREVHLPWCDIHCDGDLNREVDTRIGKANAVVGELCRSVFTKRELLNTAMLSGFKSVVIPFLTYSRHESCFLTKRKFSWVQAAEMEFLRNVHGVTLRDQVRSCEIRKDLQVEPLLPIERFHRNCVGHVVKCSMKDWRDQSY